MAKFFMLIGVLIMLGTGGCSLWWLAFAGKLRDIYAGSSDTIMLSGIVLLIGGIPFLIGLSIFNAARRADNLEDNNEPSNRTEVRNKKPPVNSFGIPPKDP